MMGSMEAMTMTTETTTANETAIEARIRAAREELNAFGTLEGELHPELLEGPRTRLREACRDMVAYCAAVGLPVEERVRQTADAAEVR
jgi:hypothetical protein